MNAFKMGSLIVILLTFLSTSLWAGTVGGKITGLKGSYVVLKNNNKDPLIRIANASFKFSHPVAKGKPYRVTISKNPLNQTCRVAKGIGVMGNLNITNVLVTCTTNKRSIGGSVVGLKGTVKLKLNNNAPINIASSTGIKKAFTFPATQKVEQGKPYLVSVVSSPVGQQCTASKNQGLVGNFNIANVTITCSQKKYSVSGLITGLSSGQVTLQNNGLDNLLINSGKSSFTFAKTIAHGSGYNITVFNTPEGLTCTPKNAIGNATANVSDILIVCSQQSFTVGGVITGLSTPGLMLKNGTQFLAIDPPITSGAAVPYNFQAIAYNGSFNVIVHEQPAGGNICSVSNGVGNNVKTQPADINVVCNAGKTIGGNYSGVTTSGLVLQNNGGNDFTIAPNVSGNGAFVLSTYFAEGSDYDISVLNHPYTKFCKFNQDLPYAPTTGTILDNVTDLQLECAETKARCWGRNNSGQIGDGTVISSKVPKGVTGLDDVTQIVSGENHSCALLENGTVKCWGYNAYGELGIGTTTDSLTPVFVKDFDGQTLTNVTALSSGNYHTCALQSDKTAKCWGRNPKGQLGDGSTIDSSVPVSVNLTQIIAISSGLNFTCALLENKTVHCWGNNLYGQLGDGGSIDNLTPQLVGDLVDVKAIDAGSYSSCALLNNGTVKCWGNNDEGQLGNSGATPVSSPPVLVTSLTNVMAITVGESHACALLQNGTMQCWGANGLGQLGTGASGAAQFTPVPVSSLNNVTAISAGYLHTCATLPSKVMCWGYNSWGQLGNNSETPSATPVEVNNLSGAKSPSTSYGTSCVILNSP
jgi:alpha-tubulin suppressor-like RCC1 family protein